LSKADAVIAVGRLMAAFRQEKLREETIQVYAEELEDLNPKALEIAVRQIIRQSRFFPAVAEIREATAEACRSLPVPKPKWLLESNEQSIDIPLCEQCGKGYAWIGRPDDDGRKLCVFCTLKDSEDAQVAERSPQPQSRPGPSPPPSSGGPRGETIGAELPSPAGEPSPEVSP